MPSVSPGTAIRDKRGQAQARCAAKHRRIIRKLVGLTRSTFQTLPHPTAAAGLAGGGQLAREGEGATTVLPLAMARQKTKRSRSPDPDGGRVLPSHSNASVIRQRLQWCLHFVSAGGQNKGQGVQWGGEVLLQRRRPTGDQGVAAMVAAAAGPWQRAFPPDLRRERKLRVEFREI